jgi:glyoxylase-like metal-dependent hydrolase (beta-lactamase superfamily II)
MSLQGTNTYVAGGGPVYVIDPGPADERHVEAVRRAAEARGRVEGVVLTHSHADHSAAVPILGYPLLLGQVGEGDELAASTPAEPPVGAQVGPFTVVATPGHAADHVCFVLGEVCFCGDLILGEGPSIVPPASLGGSLSDYMDSLRRVSELNVALLCPGHGPYVIDPKAKLDEYMEHRLARERKLVAALEGGERSRARLLELAWDDVPDQLRPAAALAMQAHLEKLATEGRLPAGLGD